MSFSRPPRFRRSQFTTGALVASLAAGPIAVTPVIAADLFSRPDLSAALGTVPIILIPGTLFGFAIALIPNFVGAALLVRLGQRRSLFRRRWVWAAVGFLSGVTIGTVILADVGLEGVLFGTIGLLCALISRHFAAWADEA